MKSGFKPWDFTDKLLGDIILKIVLNNWNAEKVQNNFIEEIYEIRF